MTSLISDRKLNLFIGWDLCSCKIIQLFLKVIWKSQISILFVVQAFLNRGQADVEAYSFSELVLPPIYHFSNLHLSWFLRVGGCLM